MNATIRYLIHSAAKPFRVLQVLIIILAQVFSFVQGPQPVQAAGGAYSLKWSAADPAVNKAPYLPTYQKVIPSALACPTPSGSAGRAADPLANAVFGNPKDSVESLAPATLALGQIVPFEMKISVSGDTTPENGVIQFTADWLTKVTSGGDFGFDPAYKVYCAFVDNADTATVDPGANAMVDSWTDSVANTGTSNEQIQGTFTVSGLDDGDSVIVEIWVVLKSSIPVGTSGNVQTGLMSAKTVANDAISTGNQTVPLLQVGSFFTANADVSITKADSPDPVILGNQLTYTLTATNNSTDTVANGVVVTDNLDPNTTFVSATWAGGTCSAASGVVTCDIGALAQGASAVITIVVNVNTGAPTAGTLQTGACTVGAAGVDLCNIAVVAAITADNTSSNNTAREPTNVTGTPALSLTKTASPLIYDNVGQVIDYSYVLTNSGNVTLDGPFTVADDKTTVSCPATASLAPGEFIDCTASYTITQADLDAVSVVNLATGAGFFNGNPVASNQAIATVTPDKKFILNLAKTGLLDMTVVAPSNRANPGDKINYTLTATNTGNQTLTGVTIADAKLGTLSCTPSQPVTLAPKASLVCTGSYTLTQADIDAGNVHNVATVDSSQTEPTDTPADVAVPQAKLLSLVKSGVLDTSIVPPSDRADPGDKINYTLTATNDGNVTLTNVTISDAKLGELTCNPSQPATLIPGASMTCTGSYTLVQTDINEGNVHNVAAADSDQTVPVNTPNDVAVPKIPLLSLIKSGVLDMTVVAPINRADPGDKINYTLTAANDGNVTLTNVTIVDAKLGTLACTPTQPATLNPGAALVCTASYTLTQADLDAEKVDNTGTADSDQTSPVDDPNTVLIITDPGLTLTKAGVLDMTVVAPSDRADPGDKINYTLTATNDGNRTLTGVTITDAKLSTLSCTPTQPATLAPGAHLICTGSYTLTLADINAGKVNNTATGDSEQTPPVDTPNEVLVPKAPHLTLTKSGVLDMTVVAPTNRADVGDQINYTLTAVNDGNITLTNVTIVDAKLGTLSCTPSQPATLAPTESLVCTGSYTLALADINAGQVDNTATGDSDQTDSIETPNEVPVPKDPHLTLTKSGVLDMTVVLPTTRADAGDKINYTLTAANDGNVTLTNVTITDAKLGTLSCNPTQPAELVPGASLVCTGSYTLLQADINAGTVHNVAIGDSDQTPPVETPNDVTVPKEPHLTLTKAGVLDMTVVAPNDRADPGDKINYTLTATNDGNITLTNVTITDAKLGTLACTPTKPATLAPGEAIVCTGSYTLTLADINAGKVNNTAIADSTQTDPIQTPNEVPVPQAPHLTLTKTGVLNMTIVAPTTRADAGDKITYTLIATNDGNITLTGVTITDAKLGTLLCNRSVPATLVPGAMLTCGKTYTLTQADIDAGIVHNIGIADSVQTPPAEAPNDVDVPQVPHFIQTKVGVLDKTVVLPATRADAGDKINYTIILTNDGNQTLTNVTIVDAKLGTLACTPDQPATLAPKATLTCTGSYTLAQGDINAGKVDNTATGDSDQTEKTETPNTVLIAKVPALKIEKSAAETSYVKVGAVLHYSYLVTNTGNVTLSDITVVDNKTSVSCPSTAAGLNPAGTITCTAAYTTVAADITAAKVTNSAYATDGTTQSAPDSVTVPFVNIPPDISVTKTANPTSVYETGGNATFTFVVTNNASEAATITSLSDSVYGTLTGDADCELGTVLASGANCSFDALLAIPAGDFPGSHKNTFTAKADDPEGFEDVASDDEIVTYTDVLPDITVTKTANPITVPEPGASVVFTFVVKNNSLEAAKIKSLSDSKFGTLVGDADCMVGTVLASGASCQFTVNKMVSGDAGVVHTNIVTVIAGDNDGNTDTATDDAVVTVTDVKPSIQVDKTASKTSVLFTGADVTYTVKVKNTSVESVILISLVDDKFGNLNGVGTCSVPRTLAIGATYTCTFTRNISTTLTVFENASHTNTVTGTVKDNENNTAIDTGSATVKFYWRGRTPGYWKNHPLGWPAFTITNYKAQSVAIKTSTPVLSVFNLPLSLQKCTNSVCILDLNKDGNNDTLLQALAYKGGGDLAGKTQNLLRAAVAALLNERYFGITYPAYNSVADLINAVNAALATQDTKVYNNLAAQLDWWNNGVH